MRFTLVDRITELEPGASITTVKSLTMGEEYLQDHFPGFPVMPGVLMLEAMTQSAAWLIRITERFRSSVILLKEAKTVKYGHFVIPGNQLVMRAELTEDDGERTVLKARGTVEDKTCVSAKLILTRFNLRDRNPMFRREDRRLQRHQIEQFQMLATAELRERLKEQFLSYADLVS